jgi:26S proteasome non-ATPase regulatory subunit 10
MYTQVGNENFYGQTALFGASSCGHTKLVEYFLDSNADFSILDEDARSPLWAAVAKNYVDVAALLLDGKADPKIPDRYGCTALHHAASIGNPELVKKLLEAGCDGLHAHGSG